MHNFGKPGTILDLEALFALSVVWGVTRLAEYVLLSFSFQSLSSSLIRLYRTDIKHFLQLIRINPPVVVRLIN